MGMLGEGVPMSLPNNRRIFDMARDTWQNRTELCSPAMEMPTESVRHYSKLLLAAVVAWGTTVEVACQEQRFFVGFDPGTPSGDQSTAVTMLQLGQRTVVAQIAHPGIGTEQYARELSESCARRIDQSIMDSYANVWGTTASPQPEPPPLALERLRALMEVSGVVGRQRINSLPTQVRPPADRAAIHTLDGGPVCAISWSDLQRHDREGYCISRHNAEVCTCGRYRFVDTMAQMVWQPLVSTEEARTSVLPHFPVCPRCHVAHAFRLDCPSEGWWADRLQSAAEASAPPAPQHTTESLQEQAERIAGAPAVVHGQYLCEFCFSEMTDRVLPADQAPLGIEMAWCGCEREEDGADQGRSM